MDFFVDAVSLGLVGFGFVLLLVAYYVHQQTARLSRKIAQLYELNQQVGQDALDFFEQAWPILEKAGILSLQAQIDWFGEQRFELFGQKHSKANYRNMVLERDDMRFELQFDLPRYRGERSSWLSLIVTTFSQILQQDLDHKHAEILASQKRLERYQMFVQHEVKNIAQFIQLLSEQVERIDHDQDKLKLFNRLQSTLPVMAVRANNTIQQMKQPLQEFFADDSVDLNILIEEVLYMYQLQADLTGRASVRIARPVLLEVFKNLLGNYRDHPGGDCQLSIEVESLGEEGALVRIQSCLDGSLEPLKSERLFEPFWTTSESGMGLGLFLTRELLKQVGSEITFQQTGQQLHFELRLNNLPALS
ncbi:MAG: ATP-binding protein [Thiomicrorhabdus chilensis]|uniref:ATP-binding protein n=1 Tax=Thiomicrorhabdus chilensis TaxID=63656 RepID=UPI00299F3285|nr:ATP-binding protein [Thiomicrorhabdus chilensis]MDX1347184.1 ATP-binding protein [Thiomicrorhabdus chilensis]